MEKSMSQNKFKVIEILSLYLTAILDASKPITLDFLTNPNKE